MTERRRSVPRWALALSAGLMTAAVLTLLFHVGVGFDLELSLVFASAFGLLAAFLVARWFAAAGVVLGLLEAAMSGLAFVVAMIAAVVGALS